MRTVPALLVSMCFEVVHFPYSIDVRNSGLHSVKNRRQLVCWKFILIQSDLRVCLCKRIAVLAFEHLSVSCGSTFYSNEVSFAAWVFGHTQWPQPGINSTQRSMSKQISTEFVVDSLMCMCVFGLNFASYVCCLCGCWWASVPLCFLWNTKVCECKYVLRAVQVLLLYWGMLR